MFRRSPFSAALALLLLATPAVAQRTLELPAEDRPLRIVVEPVYRVGGVDGPSWAAFDGINAVAFDGEGRLYALDGGNQRVVVLDAGGRFVREVGREGRGPGELAVPRDIAITGAGDLVVLDIIQRRLSRFGPDGDFLDDVPSRLGAGAPRRIFGHPEGVVGDVAVMWTDQGQMVRGDAGMRPTTTLPIQSYRIEGDGHATVLHQARLLREPTDARGHRYLTRFFPGLHVAGRPDGGVAVVDTGGYEITLVSPRGGAEAVLRRALPPRPVTERHREDERARLLDDLAAGRAPESVVSFGGSPPSRSEIERRHRQRIEDMRFPEHFPHIIGLIADDLGRLWVERMGEPHEPGPIDVIDGRGRYLGTLPPGAVTLPEAFGPGGLAVWVEAGEMDVPIVRVGRVRLEAPGPGR